MFYWIFKKLLLARYFFVKRDEKLIPQGTYCYGGRKMDLKTGKGYVKHCPYYRYFKGIPYDFGYCVFMNEESILLDDMVKICGINEDFNDGIK